MTQWMLSLEIFTGAFYNNFPDVEIWGIISYPIKQTCSMHILDLGVLCMMSKNLGGFTAFQTLSKQCTCWDNIRRGGLGLQTYRGRHQTLGLRKYLSRGQPQGCDTSFDGMM